MSSQERGSIFFLHPYPKGAAPGQRFRYEQYLSVLADKGFTIYLHSFLDDATASLLYAKGHTLRKILGVVRGYFRRLILMFQMRQAKTVFIFREAAPFGPPVFEWIIAKVLHKRIIFDFDDAIWTTDKSEHPLIRLFRWRTKTSLLCQWADTVSCGNEYLCTYAREFNHRVILNPTTIDTSRLAATGGRHNEKTITIGWTGSHSTLKYLSIVEPVFNDLSQKHPIRFLVIADREPSLRIEALVFKKWTEQNEITDLLEIDIGIMPLPDDNWARGKCGFKALQYMALGIPTIASPVGVNTKIIQSGQNGLLASSKQEWINQLELLIRNPELRRTLGKAGAITVQNQYSVQANTQNFLNLFESAGLVDYEKNARIESHTQST